MQTRIYKVSGGPNEITRLVEATSQAQAIRHVVSDLYRAEVATTKDVAQAMGSGLQVEVAGVDTPLAPPQDVSDTPINANEEQQAPEAQA